MTNLFQQLCHLFRTWIRRVHGTSRTGRDERTRTDFESESFILRPTKRARSDSEWGSLGRWDGRRIGREGKGEKEEVKFTYL